MSFLSSPLSPLRLQPLGWRLICRLRFPFLPWHTAQRELVVVASPTAPHLRRLTVYRPQSDLDGHVDDPPQAA